MKTDEKIIKYLDNELTSEEKASFERELNTSVELKREFGKYLSIKEKIERQRSIELKSEYFDSILPEFNRRFKGRKTESIRKGFSYAAGLILIIIVSVAVIKLFFNNTSNGLQDLEQFTQSLDDKQKLDLFEKLSSDDEVYSLISGEEYVEQLEKELVINSDVMENYDISYQDIVSSLSKSDAEKIYNEILKQNILEEVPL